MSNKDQVIKAELEAIAHGLYLMSPDCPRAMSTHEVDETVEALRERARKALQALAD